MFHSNALYNFTLFTYLRYCQQPTYRYVRNSVYRTAIALCFMNFRILLLIYHGQYFDRILADFMARSAK